MKIFLLILLLSISVHYDDEDGHREPWAEWREAVCTTEPRIIIDSSYSNPPCNPTTNIGVTVWTCYTGSPIPEHTSDYTSHWYCGVIGEALQRHHVFLPVVMR